MKFVLSILAALPVLAPSLALACPYAASGSACGDCGGGSLMSYGAWLLFGLGVGVTSVAFEKR